MNRLVFLLVNIHIFQHLQVIVSFSFRRPTRFNTIHVDLQHHPYSHSLSQSHARFENSRHSSKLLASEQSDNQNSNNINNNNNNSREQSDPKFKQRSKSWIVLVDDEEAIRLAVGNYLYEAGYAVTACADAEALLELLTSASTGKMENTAMPTRLPSVIVCDIRMPGTSMDGLELLDLLKNPLSKRIVSKSSDFDFVRSQWRRIPVILLTAKSFTQDRIDGYRKGADVYLPKPFDPAELLSILDNLIKRMKAIKGENSGKTLRDVKSEIIDIKAILKSRASTSNSNGKNAKRLSGTSTGTNTGDVGSRTGKRTQQQMLSAKSSARTGNGTNTRRSSAIVPHKKYQSELDELSKNVKLTEVEMDVLALLSEGHTNGEIAEKSGLSLVRVSRIISNMYSKTFTKTRTELVRWAIKIGYVAAR